MNLCDASTELPNEMRLLIEPAEDEEVWVLERVIPLLTGPISLLRSPQQRTRFELLDTFAGDTLRPLRLLSQQVLWIQEHYPRSDLGTRVWDAALALVRFLELRCLERLKRGSRFIELGCGCGVVSLAVAATASPQARVFATDLPEILDAPRRNVTLNRSLVSNICVRPLSWYAVFCFMPPFQTHNNLRRRLRGDSSEEAAVLAEMGGPADLVLGSDLVYEEALFEPLLRTLRNLAPADGTTEVIISARRRHTAQKAFFDALKPHFRVNEASLSLSRLLPRSTSIL
jgi:predicted nicotinamide N-methyase